ncbi:MAG TPA: class I SAM-dependent methyltransferase [Gemmataceae bacterium]|nr:class I SAM-dependent methyltransferase [Gemmataceae bacterium]
MPAEIWKDREVAKAFLTERSLMIPDRPRQLEVMLQVLRHWRPQAERVLDLGAGDGILLGTLLEAFPKASGIAVDFSPLMLEQARQRLSKFGQRAVTHEGDLQTTARKHSLTGMFDIIVSGLAIHHLTHERKRELYREIFDLLLPGGAFLNCEHVASATPANAEMWDNFASEHLYQRRKEKGENVTPELVWREFMERPDRAANILAPVEDQCRWLREIGYRDVDCFWKYFELAIFGGRSPATAG